MWSNRGGLYKRGALLEELGYKHDGHAWGGADTGKSGGGGARPGKRARCASPRRHAFNGHQALPAHRQKAQGAAQPRYVSK